MSPRWRVDAESVFRGARLKRQEFLEPSPSPYVNEHNERSVKPMQAFASQVCTRETKRQPSWAPSWGRPENLHELQRTMRAICALATGLQIALAAQPTNLEDEHSTNDTRDP